MWKFLRQSLFRFFFFFLSSRSDYYYSNVEDLFYSFFFFVLMLKFTRSTHCTAIHCTDERINVVKPLSVGSRAQLSAIPSLARIFLITYSSLQSCSFCVQFCWFFFINYMRQFLNILHMFAWKILRMNTVQCSNSIQSVIRWDEGNNGKKGNNCQLNSILQYKKCIERCGERS